MAYLSSVATSGTSNTPQVTVPQGIQANDIIIIALSDDNTGDNFQQSIWPTGFTRFTDLSLTLDGQRVGAGWKRATTADTGTYDFGALGSTPNKWTAHAVAFTYRNAGSSPVISSTASSNAANASPVTITANSTTAVTGDDILYIAIPDVNASGIGNGFAPPTGYSELLDTEDPTGWTNLMTAVKQNVSSGTTGSISAVFTLTSGACGWASWLVRIPTGKVVSQFNNYQFVTAGDGISVTEKIK